MPTPTGKTNTATTLAAAEVPASRAMLGSLPTQLLEPTDTFREQAKADNVRLVAKVDTLRGDIQEIKADIQGINAGITRIELLLEEQNTQNTLILDGIIAILDRQNLVTERLTQIADTVRKLALS